MRKLLEYAEMSNDRVCCFALVTFTLRRTSVSWSSPKPEAWIMPKNLTTHLVPGKHLLSTAPLYRPNPSTRPERIHARADPSASARSRTRQGPTIAGNSQHWNLPVLFSVALSLRSTDADVRLRTIPMVQSRRPRCKSSRLLRMVRSKGNPKKSAVVAISASRLGN